MSSPICRPDHALLLVACVFLSGCGASAPVREAAEFSSVQLGVLDVQVQHHFKAASTSIERQKALLRDQLATKTRLHDATTEIMAIEAAVDAATGKRYQSLVSAADAVASNERDAYAATRAYDQQLAAIRLDGVPTGKSFAAVMTALQTLASEESGRDRLRFFAGYLKTVAQGVQALRAPDEKSDEPPGPPPPAGG